MVKKTVRDVTYALDTYLKYVQSGDICENADVQRLAGSFDTREINEIIYTTLTGDHIPELILAECNEDGLTYITDGLQRTSMLKLFRYGNYKITAAIDNPIVEYSRKKRDKDGKIIKNERGQIEYEDATFNIKNKTYDMLPEELKKEFNDFQIRIVVHEDCTMKRISELIKRYNYQRPMTTSQKAFTYIDNFAVEARAISNKKFFIECKGYKDVEKINGTIERVVTESVMCMFHLDNWKRASKDLCIYLNENSSLDEFGYFNTIVDRLGNIVNDGFKTVFTSKNSFVWFTIFDEFTKLGLDDSKFVDFINKFNSELKDKVVNDITYKCMKDITYSKLDKEAGTKDKVLIFAKIKVIETLMLEFLHINKEDIEEVDCIQFVKENIEDVTDEDIELFDMVANDVSESVDIDSWIISDKNRPSYLAIVGHAIREDNDRLLNEWLPIYEKNNTFELNQEQSFLHMKNSFDKFIQEREVV